MQPIQMSYKTANEVASSLETASAHQPDDPLIAYNLRLLSVLLRECPEDHLINIDATFSATYVEDEELYDSDHYSRDHADPGR